MCVGSLEDTDSLDALVPFCDIPIPKRPDSAHAARVRSRTTWFPLRRRWEPGCQSETAWFADEIPRLTTEFRPRRRTGVRDRDREMAAPPCNRRELAGSAAATSPAQSPLVFDMACAASANSAARTPFGPLDRWLNIQMASRWQGAARAWRGSASAGAGGKQRRTALNLPWLLWQSRSPSALSTRALELGAGLWAARKENRPKALLHATSVTQAGEAGRSPTTPKWPSEPIRRVKTCTTPSSARFI